MPNALVQPASDDGSTPAVTAPLYDPRFVRAARNQFNRDWIKQLALANSFFESGGRWPSVGWILLRRGDYNAINPYATNLTLQLADAVSGTSIELQNLSIVQARCVTRGIAADADAIYLVQLTDQRGIVYNPWFQFPTTSQYNVRAPAYPGSSTTDPSQYYSQTLYSGAVYTWDKMVGDLWGQIDAPLGPYPHLPVTPTGTPEGFIFPGVPCWLAINQVLDYLGLSVAVDLTQPNAFTIVQPGSEDSIFTSMQDTYETLSTTGQNFTQPGGQGNLLQIIINAPEPTGALEDDQEYLDGGSGRVPSSVIVYFHCRYQYYGTEETARNNDQQWSTMPLHQIEVGSPAQFLNASGTGYLWSDFTIRLDVDGNPLSADVTTATTIANERVTDFYNRIYRGTQGYMRQVYSGVVPFYAGSLCDGVRWRQTGLDNPDGRLGWQTELIRGYYFDEVQFRTHEMGLTGPN